MDYFLNFISDFSLLVYRNIIILCADSISCNFDELIYISNSFSMDFSEF